MFSLLPGGSDPNPPNDVFRIRNVRLLSQCAFNPPADLNCDGAVDVADLAAFAECMFGPDAPVSAECESSALDADDDVDMHDFAAFQREYGLP